jgi:predicted CXXCH cytochrome family protein
MRSVLVLAAGAALACAASPTRSGRVSSPPQAPIRVRLPAGGADPASARDRRRAAWRAEEARRAARLALPDCALPRAVRSLTPSSSCVSCHEDRTLGIPTIGARHPYSVEYERARAAGQTLRPISETPPEIVFFQGREVTCTTCHDGGSPYRGHVAMTLAGSALCLGCHPRGG